MKDSQFLATLYQCNLLSLEQMQKLEDTKTTVDRASCFLDEAIWLPLRTKDDFAPLQQLLNKMSLSGYTPLKKFATEIKQNLDVQKVSTCNKVTGEIKREKCKLLCT